jgi:tRNA-dihydrouridine synthase B
MNAGRDDARAAASGLPVSAGCIAASRLFANGRVFLAPMAGVTEAPFRGICKRMGAALTYTEMISATGLHYNPDARATRELLALDPAETPAGVQLFGADPERMAEQAARLVDRLGAENIALFDINMGCPVTKVVAKGEGSALMREPELAAAIVSAVKRAVDLIPVTAKFRKGWDDESANAAEFAKRLEAAGADALAVHGRTRGQFYRGRADWSAVAEVKAAVNVPVLGSGDVFSADDAVAMIERTGVDGVMVARGAQGNPWIFAEANALIAGEPRPQPPTALERIALAREHGRALVAFAGEEAVVRMRKHVAWYVAGMPGATHVRTQVNRACTYAELEALLGEYAAYVESKQLPAEECA